jgi:hypothetical protein
VRKPIRAARLGSVAIIAARVRDEFSNVRAGDVLAHVRKGPSFNTASAVEAKFDEDENLCQ